MRKILGLIAISMILGAQAYTSPKQGSDTPKWFNNAVRTAETQLQRATERYQPGNNPRSTNPDGSVRTVGYKDWTTGFFPGSLWYGYELTQNNVLKEKARLFTLALDSMRYIKSTHDLGFMLYCSYGNAFRITSDKVYLPALKDGALHLAARFNPKVGAIKSWDFSWWHFPVIIDNMVNLEYLYWAGKEFNKPEFGKIASSHAITTMKNHYRKDYSSYHVVDYDSITGKILARRTHQGLADESAWARGQGWGLYGFTFCYRNTKNKLFLEQAEHIASFIMNHPKMPKDKIPAWDFDVHNALDPEERAPKDASAAAVIASALLDLSTLVKDGSVYFNYAEEILKSLSSPEYLASAGGNNDFILKHSVGAFLYNSEIDTPLNYADYYYLEALNRYKTIKAGNKSI